MTKVTIQVKKTAPVFGEIAVGTVFLDANGIAFIKCYSVELGNGDLANAVEFDGLYAHFFDDQEAHPVSEVILR